MNCCNDFGQCQQGHGCPVRTTRHYTCAELGVCNCDGPDCLQKGDDDIETPIERIAYWGVIVITSLLTVVSTAGASGYLYSNLVA